MSTATEVMAAGMEVVNKVRKHQVMYFRLSGREATQVLLGSGQVTALIPLCFIRTDGKGGASLLGMSILEVVDPDYIQVL